VAQVTIKLANGHKIKAPVEVWVWALFEAMPEAMAAKAVEHLQKLADKRGDDMQRLVDEIAN
jgi:hypothetical protein